MLVIDARNRLHLQSKTLTYYKLTLQERKKFAHDFAKNKVPQQGPDKSKRNAKNSQKQIWHGQVQEE